MVDLTPFKNQIKKAYETTHHPDPRNSFLNNLLDSGYRLNQIVPNQLIRIDSPNDKKQGKKSGWYVYHEFINSDHNIIGYGNYGCWVTGDKITWQSISDSVLSQDDKIKLQMTKDAVKKDYEKEKARLNEEAAKRAYDDWNKGIPATNHGYLKRKQVNTHPFLRVSGQGKLLIPMVVGDKLVSLQMIKDDGEKRFLRGSRTQGAYFAIAGDESRIYIAEGYATAMSINMATGNKCYCAFSGGNLAEVALTAKNEHPYAIIKIAGDHGHGAIYAKNAAEMISSDAIFTPSEEFNDFNDYHVAKGLDALTAYLEPINEPINEEASNNNSNEREYNPVGFLADVYNYYNATSGNKQHGFAIQTALAVASVITGRSFRTNKNNYPALYLMCIGNSSTGKEHPKTVIEDILEASDNGDLISGDGYTSAGAVFSALLDKPKHITVIDEMGRYLEGNKKGRDNNIQRESNTKIMECFGRCGGVIRPTKYSTMTAGKETAEAINKRKTYNPSITLLGMSTPETIHGALDKSAIKDGFVNRFLISFSKAKRSIRIHKEKIDVPVRILDWIARVQARESATHLASEPYEPNILTITHEALAVSNEFQMWTNIKIPNELEALGMAELTGRANEIAMRISLICALSENPEATTVEKRHMEWACDYVKYCYTNTMNELKISMSGSEYEKELKGFIEAFKREGKVKRNELSKVKPFVEVPPRKRQEIIKDLIDSGVIREEMIQGDNGGRPSIYYCINRCN